MTSLMNVQSMDIAFKLVEGDFKVRAWHIAHGTQMLHLSQLV
jgi:hypothetical protein